MKVWRVKLESESWKFKTFAILSELANKAQKREEFLPMAFPEFLSGFEAGFPDIKYADNANYPRYTIDSYPAASQVFSFTLGEESGVKIDGLIVWTIIDQWQIAIIFGADQTNFDKNVPMIDKIIASNLSRNALNAILPLDPSKENSST